MDSDDTGTIDFPEFLAMLARCLKKKCSFNDLEQFFAEKELNGTISIKEAIKIMEALDNDLNTDDMEEKVTNFTLHSNDDGWFILK